LIGYLTPEEYFYFIGDLRGQNKADIDALLENMKRVFNGEKIKNTCATYLKETKRK
jgi:ABC-2 type transport system ATP-binding protein